MLITTREVAALLRVHPKHVYRLLKRGLPAHRVGDEWRFDEDEVRRWGRERAGAPPAAVPALDAGAPSLLAANGDVAIEALLDQARASGAPILGHVQADHAGGLALVERGAVLLAGCHGDDAPVDAQGRRLARIHVVDRELGLAFRRGLRARSASYVVGRRFASRPPTSGIRAVFDDALRREGTATEQAHEKAVVFASHRDVVLAVVSGEADVGLSSRAWAVRAGLAFLPLAAEPYGLVVNADALGDPRVAALGEILQGAAFRATLAGDYGYDGRRTGEIRLGSIARVGREGRDSPPRA